MADKKKKKTEGLKKTPSNMAGSRNLPDIKGFDDEQIKGIFKALGREDGINFDTEDSYKKFKKRYGIDLFNSSLKQSKLFISDNLKSFARYFVSISLGFSVAFVPVVNNTVRSYSESLFDKLISFEFLQEKIETKVIQTETLEYELNEIVNEAMLSKQPIELKPFPNGYSLKISNFKANEPDQASLKIKLKVHSTFEGNLKVEIIKK